MENPQKSEETENGAKKPMDKWSMIGFAWELGYIIAIPIVIFGLVGKWLDSKFHHSFPYLTLIGILLAIISTTYWMIQRLKKYIK